VNSNVTSVGKTLDFDLQTDTGERLSLSSLRGRTVILYFYPKDDTSGCTMESCAFRDLFPRFIGSDAVILGISPDDVASHQKFKAKYNLPFTLLVDENHALAEQLGLWVEKQLYGQKYMGVARTTYIIGPDGEIRHVFEKVNPAGHAEEVMAFLQGGAESARAARAAYDAAMKAASPSPPLPAAAKPVAQEPAAKQPAKKPTQQATKKPSKQPAKKPRTKVTKTPSKPKKKIAKKAAKKRVSKASRKPAKRLAKKPRKTAPKRRARKAKAKK